MDSTVLFLTTSIALILMPGPDMIYVLTRGISGGKIAGLLSAIGVVSGILIHTLAAAFGLSILLQTSVVAFWIVKIAGGLYLIYMGIQLMANKDALQLDDSGPKLSMRKCMIQGFLSNLLNPKVALFFVAFLPQFVDPASTTKSWEMIQFGLVFAGLTILVLAILGWFSGSIGNFLKANPTYARYTRIGSGGILALLGLKLLVPQQK
jgi:threonine/homoserine/homoserine lactone efflux protein